MDDPVSPLEAVTGFAYCPVDSKDLEAEELLALIGEGVGETLDRLNA